MSIFEEIARETDFSRPQIIITDDLAVLENVSGIVMLSETAVTVSHGRKPGRTSHTAAERAAQGTAGSAAQGSAGRTSHTAAERTSQMAAGRQWFTTITGTNLVIREICEGRLLIGGKIQRAEFLQP